MFEDVQSFSFLGLSVYKYGLFLAFGAAAWIILTCLLARKRRLPMDAALLLVTLALPLGLLFARVLFCLIRLEYFLEVVELPVAMLYFWDGGLSMMGALLGVSLAALLTAWIKKVRFGILMDVLAAPAGAFLFFARLGENYTTLGRGRSVGIEALRGSPLTLTESWGGGEDVLYAVFRMEAAVALILLAIMLWLFFSKKIASSSRPGDLALVFGALFGAPQVILESMRDDGHLLWGFVRASQIISILLPVAAVIIFSARLIRREGISWRPAVALVVTAGSIAVAILKEFDIDTSSHLVREYTIMSLAMAALAAAALLLWWRLRRGALQR